MIEERLMRAFRTHPNVAERLSSAIADVRAGKAPAAGAADELLSLFRTEPRPL